MADAFAHCGYCGAPFASPDGWPRVCPSCKETSYRNPLPVTVMLLPVTRPSGTGLVLIRRGIPPHVGKLALPGGYVNWGESWQEAGAREVREETGIAIDPRSIREHMIRSAPNGTLLLFGLAAPLAESALPAFVPTDETTELLVASGPMELAFDLHTAAAAAWWSR